MSQPLLLCKIPYAIYKTILAYKTLLLVFGRLEENLLFSKTFMKRGSRETCLLQFGWSPVFKSLRLIILGRFMLCPANQQTPWFVCFIHRLTSRYLNRVCEWRRSMLMMEFGEWTTNSSHRNQYGMRHEASA